MHKFCHYSFFKWAFLLLVQKNYISIMIHSICIFWTHLSQLMRLWYLSRQPAKAQVSLHSLARAFAVSTHEVWKQTKGPTKNQTFSSTGWLCMHVWRMSLRRTKSTIITWAGSLLHFYRISPMMKNIFTICLSMQEKCCLWDSNLCGRGRQLVLRQPFYRLS